MTETHSGATATGDTGTGPTGAPASRESAAVLAIRVLLVLAASLAVLLGAPTAVTAVLSPVALLVVAERLARTRRRGPADTVLLACGGTLVVLILVGLVLGVSGIGLHRGSWAVALGVLGLLGLAAAARLDRPLPDTQQPGHQCAGTFVRTLPWVVASVAVVAAALTLSVHATDRADVEPLQLSLGTVRGTTAQIVVSTGRDSGQLELRTQAEDGTSLSYPLFSVESGRPTTTTVVLPASGRFIITINNPGQTEPLRSLTLER